jgi:acyl dehydratase
VRVEELRPGLELGPSTWIDVPQERIDAFAEATDDRQWIHVDPAAAAAGPFGTTVAHGYLTLALLVPASYEVLRIEDARLVVNYGLDRVRFPAPVPAGSRLRASFRIANVERPGPGAVQVRMEARVEREGGEKPVCVAELLVRLYPEPRSDPK